jgi:ATP-dependent Lhr-like helicase
LQTHALIGLSDLTARYPLPAFEAAELLESWCEEGKVVRIGEDDRTGESRWAERGNLTEMRRATVAALRRETLTVLPEVFADFLLRHQHVHTPIAGEGAAAVEGVLEQLQGYGAGASMWEDEILPRRIKGYRPAWLDDVLAQGNWYWRAEGSARDEVRVAFFKRDFPGASGATGQVEDLTASEIRVLEVLERHGASFAVDVARLSALEPSQARGALRSLMRRGIATNDRFDPVREGADRAIAELSKAGMARRAGLPLRPRAMRAMAARPEGRWWRLPVAHADDEASLLAWAEVLLARYGVVMREVIALEPLAPKSSRLSPLLARAEWRGELRRGYFVEGLSGLQYATEEAASELARLAAVTAGPSAGGARAREDMVMVCAADPANIYGAGAPLDIELLEDGVARLPRGGGNYLVIRDGRPVLIMESRGKRLTGLAWADRGDLDRALGFLPALAGSGHRVLKVETYNGGPVADSAIQARLGELGFVRDYPGMTFYAGWPGGAPQAKQVTS